MAILSCWRSINNPPSKGPKAGRTAPRHRGPCSGAVRRSSAIGPDRPPPRIATDAYKKIEGRSCDRAPTIWLLAPRTVTQKARISPITPIIPAFCLDVQLVHIWERGCFLTTILAQRRIPRRSRHPYAAPRTSLQSVCTRHRNCIERLSPFLEYALGTVDLPSRPPTKTWPQHLGRLAVTLAAMLILTPIQVTKRSTLV
jgi:hypothetical protein